MHVLNELKSNVDFKLKAVHVNHNIRGQEAIRDEEMVKKYCDKLGVELEIAQVMAVEHAQKHKLTLEQAARNLRYNVFRNKISFKFK